jgi:hypothetical protein
MATGCQVRRDGETVRLFTRRGYDWSERYPAIARHGGCSPLHVPYASRIWIVEKAAA